MKSYEWGPFFWYCIHKLTYHYDNKYVDNYIHFFHNLKYIIPCPICRKEYKKFMNKSPPNNNCKNRDGIIKWNYDFHNFVNKYLKKPHFTMDQFNKIYSQPTDHNKIIKFIDILGSEFITSMELVRDRKCFANFTPLLKTLGIEINDIDIEMIKDKQSLKKFSEIFNKKYKDSIPK